METGTTYRSTSVLIPNRFDSKQKNHSSSSSYRSDAPPEIPPSPTLTNPDMILPDDGERQSSTPSPPFQFSSSDSHMLQATDYRSNGSTAQAVGTGPMSYRPSRPRWTYDGHVHGRPLSDIGEEDLQSSTSSSGGRHTSDRHPAKSDTDSIGSGSTISAGSQQRRRQQQEQQGNVHTAGSGDHETDLDSKRNSFASQGSIERARAQASDALASGPSQLSEEESSSAILSSEAERILENAKRRLTLMEGNLTRARSSMRLTQTPSPSPNSSGHLLPTRNLQPAGELYRSISQTDRRSSLLRPRPVYTTAQEGGHSRGHSETKLTSGENLSSPTIQPSRSMSALASSSSSQYETAERSFPYNAAANNGYTQPTPGHNPPPMQHNSDNNGSAGLGISTSKSMPKMATMDDFNSAYPPDDHDPPSRAQSQLQVRDLKDQAAGLRTKVALLKVKTQEDSLRRRSLQSLRTPSPFTAADRWYTSALEQHGNTDAGYGWVPEAGTTQESSNGQSLSDGTSEVTIDVPANSQMRDENTFEARQQQHVDDRFTYETDDNSMLESHYEDAEEGEFDEEEERDIDRNALNRILNEPYDDDDDDGLDDNGSDIFEDFPPGNPPEATPHEEREDAFDYENFYLHSALGTFSRSKMRRRSYDSVGSNETTRPLQGQRAGRHSRSGSGDSVSTFATFATATENAYDGDHDDALHAIDRIVDAWDAVGEENEDEDASTPVQSRRTTFSKSRIDQPRYLAAGIRGDSPLTPTGTVFGPAAAGFMKGRDVSTPSTPVDAFMSSLSRSSSSRPPSSLKADDTRLLEQVFESLGKVCTELQELTLAAPSSDIDIGDGGSNGNTSTADPKYIRTLRRRLDAARRVLDGQLDSDA